MSNFNDLPRIEGGDWPDVALGNVARMRVLAAALPNAAFASAEIDEPFDRVWNWFSDMERSVPSFDGQVRRLQVRSRDETGTRLRIRTWQGPGGLVPTPLDVVLEPDGWCLMTAPARLYVVGMCADPIVGDRTRVAVLEALPRRWAGRLAHPFIAHHVKGDASRIAAAIRATP